MIDVADGASIGSTEAAAELAFGAQLRSYRFDKYKTKQKPEQKPSLNRLTDRYRRREGRETCLSAAREDRGSGVYDPRFGFGAGKRDLP